MPVDDTDGRPVPTPGYVEEGGSSGSHAHAEPAYAVPSDSDVDYSTAMDPSRPRPTVDYVEEPARLLQQEGHRVGSGASSGAMYETVASMVTAAAGAGSGGAGNGTYETVANAKLRAGAQPQPSGSGAYETMPTKPVPRLVSVASPGSAAARSGRMTLKSKGGGAPDSEI